MAPLSAALVFFLGATSPCAAPPIAPPTLSMPLRWQPTHAGIELAEVRCESPRRIRGWAARINLQQKGLSLLATPDNGDRPGQTDGLKTSTFLAKYNCQLAINAAPFSPIHKEEGKPQTISGLTVSGGKIVSPATRGYPAILFSADLFSAKIKARISSPPFDLKNVETAVAGFQIVLKNGKVQRGAPALHPRTAAGLTADSKILYLLVIDGRQKDHSQGVTTAEVGVLLQTLGATEGINLDGGGTTTLVLSDNGKPRVVNRPIHAGKPGQERVSASHLGIFALPLPRR